MRTITGQIIIVTAVLCVSCTRWQESSDSNVPGIKQLDSAQSQKLISALNWQSHDVSRWKILGAFAVDSDFQGDMKGANLTSFSGHINDQVQNQALDRTVILAQKRKVKVVDEQIEILSAVGTGRYNAAGKKLNVTSELTNRYLDLSEAVGRHNNNQIGEYLVVEPSNGRGVVFVVGKTFLQLKFAQKPTVVSSFLVAAAKSPFQSMTNPLTEKYLIPHPIDFHGEVIAFDLQKVEGETIPPHPPNTMTKQVVAAGDLAAKAEIFRQKLDSISLPTNLVDKENQIFASAVEIEKKNTTEEIFVNRDLIYYEPKQVGEPLVIDEMANGPQVADVEPENNITQRKADDRDPQIDFSFNGMDIDGNSTLVPWQSDSIEESGWKFVGDVAATAQNHETIFGSPEFMDQVSAGKYLERTQGYFLLSTGDGMYQESGNSSQYLPLKGRESYIEQNVKIPVDAKSIQLRVALFTQEFPRYLGRGISDSVAVKFIGTNSYVYQGNLAEAGIQGGNNKSISLDLSNCHLMEAPENCGRWQSLSKELSLDDSGWWITKSTHAVEGKCNSSAKKCYSGWMPPKVICQEIPKDLLGQTKRLRISISDGLDQYWDSALAVDSLVFSKQGCDSTFTGEEVL